MSSTKIISFGPEAEAAITALMADSNRNAQPSRRASEAMLKTVYRRGASTFSASHRPGATRSSWAMDRVTAFTRMLRTGRPSNSAYTSDNDLLPVGHPRSTASSDALTASAYTVELTIALPETNTFAQPEDAILALTEFSGMGYEIEPAIRASWLRAVRNGEDPYRRSKMLAELTYNSLDSDLLPVNKKGSSS